jgi:hypothetical protein
MSSFVQSIVAQNYRAKLNVIAYLISQNLLALNSSIELILTLEAEL